MSYYDVDAILTDAEKIPCEFQIDVPGLGYLDQNPAHTLKAGTRLALPLWLAEMLALANSAPAPSSSGGVGADSGAPDEPRPFVTLNLPSPLRHEVVQALKADARAVPLRDQSAHFYALATRMLDLFEDADLAAVLRAAFVRRADEIGLHARKVGGQAASAASAAAAVSASASAGGSGPANTGAGAPGAGTVSSHMVAVAVGGHHHAASAVDRRDDAGNTSSNLGVGPAGQEFLRGLDEWERLVFRHAHDGAKAGREFVDNVKRNY